MEPNKHNLQESKKAKLILEKIKQQSLKQKQEQLKRMQKQQNFKQKSIQQQSWKGKFHDTILQWNRKLKRKQFRHITFITIFLSLTTLASIIVEGRLDTMRQSTIISKTKIQEQVQRQSQKIQKLIKTDFQSVPIKDEPLRKDFKYQMFNQDSEDIEYQFRRFMKVEDEQQQQD